MDRSHLEFLKVYAFDKKIRLGIQQDGGYVIADLSGGYDCYISAGVGREESFSKEFIERYGMNEFNSFGIDSSIENYPIEYTNSISFIKKNISYVNDSANTNLRYLTKIYSNIFLKMDIEGGEYGWIRGMTDSELSKFRQITIEVHGVNNDSWGTSYEVKKECLQRLSNTHYLVHAHGNNARGTTNYIPNVFELTYIRKNELSYIPSLNTRPLPNKEIDFPNNVNRLDHPLNMPPFVNK
jgi:hypothetical protein